MDRWPVQEGASHFTKKSDDNRAKSGALAEEKLPCLKGKNETEGNDQEIVTNMRRGPNKTAE